MKRWSCGKPSGCAPQCIWSVCAVVSMHQARLRIAYNGAAKRHVCQVRKVWAHDDSMLRQRRYACAHTAALALGHDFSRCYQANRYGINVDCFDSRQKSNLRSGGVGSESRGLARGERGGVDPSPADICDGRSDERNPHHRVSYIMLPPCRVAR